ncbi:MAG: multifunctional acyl-CoA thioesterase and protease and lysophospholipase [Phycisphaerales bacterium]|nr:multifunctional acyl-CoA thioesterase and protease and lysophospholipase [Phycisphaerales bacterium]
MRQGRFGTRLLAIAGLLWIGTCSLAPAVEPATQPATRAAKGPARTVVCFGDSLTKIGFGDVLGDFVPATVVNAGQSGQTTEAALPRFEKDVLARSPDVVVILFGTNDMVRDKPTPKVDLKSYAANLTSFVDRIQARHARVVMCTVPPIKAEPYFTRHPKANYDAVGGLEKVIADYRDAAMHVAELKQVAVVDLNHLLATHPEWQAADGVHPTPEGRRIMAAAIAPAVIEALNSSANP